MEIYDQIAHIQCLHYFIFRKSVYSTTSFKNRNLSISVHPADFTFECIIKLFNYRLNGYVCKKVMRFLASIVIASKMY